MIYTFETQLTPRQLEADLGMAAGTIKELTIFGTGAVEVNIPGDLAINTVRRAKLAEVLVKYGLPRGKKGASE